MNQNKVGNRKLVKFSSFVVFASLAAVLGIASLSSKITTASVEATGSPFIYNNGGLATGTTSNSGVSAPAGTQWSEAQNATGNTTESNTLAGVSCSLTATLFRCADDFTVPAGQTWTVNQVVTYAYQTGFAGSTSPITGATVQIWNGRPGDAGATVIFGDTTTNRLATSTNSNLFRIFNSAVPAPGTTPATNRIIWENRITVSPAQVLSAGTYWVDFQTQVGATTAHFAPPVTIPGVRGLAGWNARQFNGTAWVDVIDTGNPATAPDFPQDFPFKLVGSVVAPSTQNVVDFDGNGRTDFAVARNTGGGTGGQVTWFYATNPNGTTSAFNWGISTDLFVPEDYDGDGKTDIAVWRSGAPTVASFYILQSNGFTLRQEAFGQTGDDPTVVGDYTGDGKADLAVYRAGATSGAQSTWYYRSTANGPVTFVNWGQNGDFVAPGDYDGDGKNDFVVQRNNGGGQARFWRLLSNSSSDSVVFGTPTDVIVPGDYDGDGKTDLAVVRGSAGAINWYYLPSSGGNIVTYVFGASATDFLTQGDYDGDGKTDPAIWRPSLSAGLSAFWYRGSSNGTAVSVPFGATGDYPVANFNTH